MTEPVDVDVAVVPKQSLRKLRSLVGGVLVGLLILVGAVVLAVVDSNRRCNAGNEFRRRDLPAAFRIHDQHLGRALGASDERIEVFDAEFRADLLELFPERDCSLL